MTDKKRPAVIICPGGAYRRHAAHQADPVALSFLAGGYQAFVLYYSIYDTNNNNQQPLGLKPLLELGKSIMTLRENAGNWRINEAEIVVCGFSAGGHLAATALV